MSFWQGFSKRAAGGQRPMASTITASMKPQLVIAANLVEPQSQLMIKRLDKALQSSPGYERAKITVLNPMMDRQTIDQLDIDPPGVCLYRSGKKIAAIGPSTEMEFTRFLNANRGSMV